MGTNRKVMALAVASALCRVAPLVDDVIIRTLSNNRCDHAKRGKKGKFKKDWQK